MKPQVAGGRDGLQIFYEAENVLEMKSWSADKGLSSSLKLGWECNNSSPKN